MKKLLIIFTVLILFSVGLSSCDSLSEDSTLDEIELNISSDLKASDPDDGDDPTPPPGGTID